MPFESDLKGSELEAFKKSIRAKAKNSEGVTMGEPFYYVCSSCKGRVVYTAAILPDSTRLETFMGHEGFCNVIRPEGL